MPLQIRFLSSVCKLFMASIGNGRKEIMCDSVRVCGNCAVAKSGAKSVRDCAGLPGPFLREISCDRTHLPAQVSDSCEPTGSGLLYIGATLFVLLPILGALNLHRQTCFKWGYSRALRFDLLFSFVTSFCEGTRVGLAGLMDGGFTFARLTTRAEPFRGGRSLPRRCLSFQSSNFPQVQR